MGGDRAKSEASKYATVDNVFHCGEQYDYMKLPDSCADWSVKEGTKYCHIVSNETIHGLQYHYDPDISANKDIPILTCDMTSDLMSRPVDVSKYGVIFASSGKNLGPAGVCVAIVRDDLLPNAAQQERIPSVLD